MAGNITADNSGNILVEFDYNNIIVVDPNKTIDPFGKISERLVDHENLVMYANLEAELLPRTKLAVGGSPTDRIQTISIAKIDFLKPNDDKFLTTGYYDELTGKGSTIGKGQNQMQTITNAIQGGGKPYITEKPADLNNIIDNGLLGITQIQIDTNLSFIPTVRMSLEDVQGRALFQLGNNSPYAAFFNLPYPPFYLTLKGFYGQAVRYQLNLEKFNARFNTYSGNYQIELDFRGYKFNILNEVAVGHLIALPHMYGQRYNVAVNPVGNEGAGTQQKTETTVQTQKNLTNATNNTTQQTVQLISEKGYQKIIEVYSEYKAKGLIEPNFPELTLVQFMTKLEMFEQTIASKFSQVEVQPLTNIRNYRDILTNYYNSVRGAQNSWFVKYLNPKPIILTSGLKVYAYQDFNLQTKNDATKQLEDLIKNYNKQLAENPTLGAGGKSKIPNPITFKNLTIPPPSAVDGIDYVKTAELLFGLSTPSTILETTRLFSGVTKPVTETKIVDGKVQITDLRPPLFIFDGDGRFDKQIAALQTQANKKLSEYESILTAKLLEKIESGTDGIGFKPTVRNIMAVIMASTEAFIRLLDDVHQKAWDVRNDPIRKRVILGNPSSAPSSDAVDFLPLGLNSFDQNTALKQAEIPVYPWPQYFVETPEDKKGRFQLKYIGDFSQLDYTQGGDYSKWPEVEFVEEYLRGITQKFNSPLAPPPLDNQRDTRLESINAIEFPSTGVAYANKEEIKFYYEIWERQFLTANYSNYIRATPNQYDELIKLNAETESNNIVESLGLSAPYITLKLKNFLLNSANYQEFLNTISNQGTGRAWQDFIRGFYVTPYIKNLTENSFSILQVNDLGKVPQIAAKSEALLKLVSNATNDTNITDTLPFTNNTWTQESLANGYQKELDVVYNTNQVLTVYEPRKIISNFNELYNFDVKRPVTNFSYRIFSNPFTQAFSNFQNGQSLTNFYNTRVTKDFMSTEGYYIHRSPSFNFSSPTETRLPLITTTSLLNTPYMVNAIQNGVQNIRDQVKNPFVQAAYLFLNSLPLATTREKYKNFENDIQKDLDYVATCLKKFGGVHKLPYSWILKYGSIWHRYKVYKETGRDILDTAWKNFDYKTNYSPKLSSLTQTYEFTYKTQKRQITLQSGDTQQINIQVGFYPKLINDFFNFYNGYDVYKDFNDTEIQNTINGGMKIYNFPESNLVGVKQGVKNLNLTTWSVLIPGIVEKDETCSPYNNTQGTLYFIVPSFGSPINQTVPECIVNRTTTATTVVDLTDNSSMYNGSIRLLWPAPNYGFFNNDQIFKPSPERYLNRINASAETQSPFTLYVNDNYSTIEEIFSVFDKKILDAFEQQFLDFCKPMTDIDMSDATISLGLTNGTLSSNFLNFQSLFRSLMAVNPQIVTTDETAYFNNIIDIQYNNFQNTMRGFLEYDILFRYGNPSNYKRRVFDSYLSHNAAQVITDPIIFKPYVKGTLPGGGTTLTQSRAQNPQAWFTLETEVGFSTIPNVEYTLSGSYFTDFFIQSDIEFTVDNIVLLAPLIKMFATYKLKNPSTTLAQFREELSKYILSESNLQANFLNEVMNQTRRKLPNQQQLPQTTINSVITGEQSKVETWEIFKALNDKWIAGGDYKSKTLFEDILFFDRASRNIGQTVFLDIFDIKTFINKNSLNNAMSVFTLMSSILIKNNFTVMNLPAYVNFYNVQDVDGTTIPKQEGSLDFANNLWGTFLNVDYRNSTSKMICFYVGKPSNYLDLPKGNFRFRDDSFELRRASENPLIENWNGKKDWSISNRCVGFNVDIGIRNQNIFYSFQVGQENGVATSESINTLLNITNQASGRNVATQNVSLYNLYKQRSYKCSVISMGNALIQPSMYFNLRHVPMFNGPYMIQNVQHTIQPGNFQTSFTGIRQGMFDLPSIDTFLQSINQNLLTKLEEILNIKKDSPQPINLTEQQQSQSVVQQSENKLDAQNSCTTNVDLTLYTSYDVVAGVAGPNLTAVNFATRLKSVLPGDVNKDLRTYIFVISYISSYQKKSQSFVGYNNNYSLISLDNNFQPNFNNFFDKKYCCVSITASTGNVKSLPIVAFKDIDTYINFMASRLKQNLTRIASLGIDKYYACYWPKDNISESYFDENKETEFLTLRKNVDEAIRLCTNKSVGLLDPGEMNNNGQPPTPTSTPTYNPATQSNSLNTGCPPPVISSFAPTIGNEGSTLQIVGKYLDSTIAVYVCGVKVEGKNVTNVDAQTLRVVVPKVGTGDQVVNGKIQVDTFYGTFTTTAQFRYDPSVPAAAASSPGSIVNGASNSNVAQTSGVNTNPQNTGKPTMISQLTKLTPNRKSDGKLIVKMDPNTPSAVINSAVLMNVSVFKNYKENNVPKQELVQTSSSVQTNLVNNNEFTVTWGQLSDLLINRPISPFNRTPILNTDTVIVQFTINATPVDRNQNPNNTEQSFNFLYQDIE